MKLAKIKIFTDNYIWILISHNKAIVIDPGNSDKLINFLKKNNIILKAVLLTHHHFDHVGGVKELKKQYPKLIVFGPEETMPKGANHIVREGDLLDFCGFTFQVFSVPGHTLGHVVYYNPPYLFCGDTLFSGGCGRIFEGTHKQMFFSIQKIKNFPDETLICCGHEYTFLNMKFANFLFPLDKEIQSYFLKVKKIYLLKQSTVPTRLNDEKKINVFLRFDDILIQKALGFNPGINSNFPSFVKMRKLKDFF